MTVKTIKSADLQPGDILLKLLIRDKKSDPVSNLIFASQLLTGAQHAYVTHAGIMFDKSYIIESQGVGINANDVRVQNKDIAYAVYRCNNINVARGAATAAKMLFDIHKTGKSFSYNLGGAIGSLFNTGSGQARTPATMDDLLENVLVKGKSSSFFCSQFVVYVYQFVGVQNMFAENAFFKGADAKVNPAHLLSLLQNNPKFELVGFMKPGIR